MKRAAWIVLALMSSSFVLAQAPGERPGRGERQDRGERQRPGGRLDGPGRMGGGPARLDGWFQRMAEQLNLDANQQVQFDQIRASLQERMRQARADFEEMEAARQAGDRELAAELRAQMAGGGMGNPFEESLDQIEKILRPDQLDTFHELRQDWGRRGGADGRRQIVQIARELPGVVGFDKQQQELFNELLDSRRDRMRERMSEMQGFWDELRAAREAGDEARLAELRALMAEMRPSPEQQVSALLDEVALFLRPDQMKVFAEYREQLSVGQDPARRTDEVETMLRLVRRMGLSDEQRDELKLLEDDVKLMMRDVRRGDQEAQAQIAAEVRDRIHELLTTEQAQRFQEQLERQSQRARRGAR